MTAVKYSVNWEVSTKFKRDTFKIFIAIIIFFIGVGIILVMYELSLSNLYGAIGFILFTLFMVSLLITSLIWRDRFLKYNAIKKVVLFRDGMLITSLKGLMFRVKFDNIGLIDRVRGIKYSDISFEEFPFIILVYYNSELDSCVEIYLDREVGDIIADKYLKYCKEKGIAYAPILEGFVENSGIVDEAISRIKSSSFCRRRG